MSIPVLDQARHTAYSFPGPHASLLEVLPTVPAELSAVARNVIVHYRASGETLPDATRSEINSRWITAALAADQARHPWPLAVPREITDRVQGCCRDHTLFCVAALREHGVPARSRVGFAGYFVDGWHLDHVIVEAWIDGRWRRFDSEIESARPGLERPMDLSFDAAGGRGFVTAATAWIAYRRGELDLSNHGVDPSMPLFSGERFVFDEVIYEVAHRFGDEMLLWDSWGRIGIPGSAVSDEDAAWLDEVSSMLIAADAGDLEVEQQLLDRYRNDAGLHPADTVMQHSPFGEASVEIELRH
jgi:Transglutaminase-like superfamily